MSRQCEYCGSERGENECVAIVSHGFGHGNKEWIPFCSVECRVWWRRRCSDEPGAWEQPMKPGYQGRLDRFVTDDSDERATQPDGIAGSEAATVEVRA